MNLFRVTTDNGSGYVNEQGEIVLEPKHDSVGTFSDGLSYLNHQGEVRIINLRQETLGVILNAKAYESFSDGYLTVKINDKFCFVDDRANIVLPPIFDMAFQCIEGAAVVAMEGKYGLIRMDGEWMIEPKYKSMSPFVKNSVATSVELFDSQGAFRIIGYDGRFLSDEVFAESYICDHGVIPARNFQGGWFLIEPSGIRKFTRTFELMHPQASSSGIGVAENGLWGLITHDGVWQISPRYHSMSHEYCGLRQVRTTSKVVGGKIGFINRSGAMVIPAKYDFATYFHQGVASVSMGDLTTTWRQELIDSSGDVIWSTIRRRKYS